MQFTTALVAAMALFTGAQAACPANGTFCGSELVDVYQCITAAQLQALQIDIWRTDLFPTDASGNVLKATATCRANGCRNSNGDKNRPPTVFARCN
ncbi:hypothetical protein QBC34DRAFT_384084 [Podospora aff. communis PSN243]|uniref:Uncharacterized protein n=1 Tax=Podospora aff. communis PSN243 TaxID=3040156 RepID=A0AAV9GB86_9PEZI|nr:hypothetical protein QBC34DRAFT_384084 [Podospora aff. communis PSN243]